MQLADSLSVAADRVLSTADAVGETVFDTALWFTLAQGALRAGLVILLALTVLGVVGRIKTRWARRVEALPALDPRRQRVLTVSDLFGSAAKYLIWLVAAIMVLAELGLDIGPLLAGAGVAGLAIGFGAQTLVKDVISGVFLLFDHTIRVGDLVRINNESGTVEYIGLRLIKVRKFDGEVLMVPAGELRVFGNKSMGFARVIVEVGLSYEQDVDDALAALESVAREWAEAEEHRAIMLQDEPEVQAVMALADSAVTARIVIQVRPGEQFAAERELRRLIKRRFDQRGIEIPFPRRTVYVRSEDGAPVNEETARAAAAAGAGDDPPTDA